jgi:hypothetical protein
MHPDVRKVRSDRGVQVDHMIVLEGKGAVGKTTFYRHLMYRHPLMLCAEQGDKVSKGDPRFERRIEKAVIVYWQEMAVLSRASEADVKFILTDEVSTPQHLYETDSTPVPRRCVHAGDSNDQQYLTDRTGNRRFWGLAVAQTRPSIDLEWTSDHEHIDLLLGEAAHRFLQGEKWWPEYDDDMSRAVEERNVVREEVDFILEQVAELVDSRYDPGTHRSYPSLGVPYPDRMFDPKWEDGTQIVRVRNIKQLCALLNRDGSSRLDPANRNTAKRLTQSMRKCGFARKSKPPRWERVSYSDRLV